MDTGEFRQQQINRIDQTLYDVRCDIERLMQFEEMLVAERERWAALGHAALTPLHAVPDPDQRPRLTLLQGGEHD